MSETQQRTVRCDDTDGIAFFSLLSGIIGLAAWAIPPLCLIFSFAAVVLGLQSRDRLREHTEMRGANLALAGAILGWLGIASLTLTLLLPFGMLVLGAID